MRIDAAHLLTEDGRHGGRSSKGKKTGLKLDPRVDWIDTWDDEDTGPSRISSGRHRQHGWGAKELGDYLSPLQNFLNKNCGRPWNDTYSEICAVAPMRSMNGNHLRDHVRSYLKYQYKVDDEGILRSYDYWRNRYGTPRYSWPDRRANEQEADWYKISDILEYKVVDGNWFRFEYSYRDPNELKSYWDWTTHTTGYKKACELYKKACEFDNWNPRSIDMDKTIKRQASKREMNRIRRFYGYSGLNQAYVERTGKYHYVPIR